MLRKKVKTAVFYLTSAAFSFFTLLPFFWMVITSFKEKKSLGHIPIQWIPDRIVLQGYIDLFKTISPDFFLRAFQNTIFVSVVTTIVTVSSAALAAYVFSKMQFKLRETLFMIYIAALMVPEQVITIPKYMILDKLDLLGTFTGLIMPSVFNAFAVFLLRQHIKNISDDFIDAAVIDGSSSFWIFKNIIIPLSRTVIISLCVIQFLTTWNDYYWPLVVLNNPFKKTLTLALGMLNSQHQARYDILMAGSLLSVFPILIIYFVAQEYFESGMQLGGLKG